MNKHTKIFFLLGLFACICSNADTPHKGDSADKPDESCAEKVYQDACLPCFNLCKADTLIPQATCNERMRGCCQDKHFTKCTIPPPKPAQKPSKIIYLPAPPPMIPYNQNQIPMARMMQPGQFQIPGLMGMTPGQMGGIPYNQMGMGQMAGMSYNQMPTMLGQMAGMSYNQMPMMSGQMPTMLGQMGGISSNQMPMMSSGQFQLPGKIVSQPGVGPLPGMQVPSLDQQILSNLIY